MENLILVVIAILTLTFTWVIWARQTLVDHLRSFQRRDELLRRDMQKRRDMTPLLLESFRQTQEITPQWQALMNLRQAFHSPERPTMHQEEEFENALIAFIESNEVPTVDYLAAEKSIKDLTEVIERAKHEWAKEYDQFVAHSQKPPFVYVSKIFAIH